MSTTKDTKDTMKASRRPLADFARSALNRHRGKAARAKRYRFHGVLGVLGG
jgi:hypothetical protein